mmetsp:Transcript_48906/g.87200  ORF Transcript_48906/g.87200 Transcript_48906/m.87200 type:complete len:136 (-) Transcript_48906:78-485(-)
MPFCLALNSSFECVVLIDSVQLLILKAVRMGHLVLVDVGWGLQRRLHFRQYCSPTLHQHTRNPKCLSLELLKVQCRPAATTWSPLTGRTREFAAGPQLMSVRPECCRCLGHWCAISSPSLLYPVPKALPSPQGVG